MSADRRTRPRVRDDSDTTTDAPAASTTEHAVLTVLAGTALTEVAQQEGMQPAELTEALRVYRQAGHQALHQQTSNWWQVYVQFANWSDAEPVVVRHLAPLLYSAEADGTVAGWWFMRKHPCWRLRLRPGSAAPVMRTGLGTALDALVDNGHIAGWWSGRYEAETAAFGGVGGMEIAHELFCADSRAVLEVHGHGDDTGLGRRELSVLLCGILMRAAGLEWYEQGDVWHRVARERPLPTDVAPTKLEVMSQSLRQLLRADTSAHGPLFGTNGPVAFAAEWADAFRAAGQHLGMAARAGTLHRGLRDILSYHVIFHWNRLGLPTRTQSILAHAAQTAFLGPPTAPQRTQSAGRRGVDTAIRVRLAPDAEADMKRAVARFPLVFQGRRRCADLATRIRDVQECARSCHTPEAPEDRIDRACAVYNLAALIAADCALPGLAVELCQRQFQNFRSAWPVSGRTAIAALQPAINLARLTRRAGDPDGAHHTLCQINHAVHNGGNATVHGTSVSFDGFTITEGDRSLVVPWLRTVLREDGTRALAAAGQWTTAASHAHHYDDAHEYLREARQTRIIAHIHDVHTDTALKLINASATTEPWEDAVAACLRIYAHLTAERLDTDDLAALLAAVRHARQHLTKSTTLFGIRLGLAAADLAAAVHPDHAIPLHTELIDVAEQSGDAFAAREVRDHPGCHTQTTSQQAKALTEVLHQAGLGAGSIPHALLDNLMTAVHTAESVLTQTLER